MAETQPEYLTADQVADRLDISYWTVLRYLREGRIAAVRIGDRYRVSPVELDRILREGISDVER